MDLAYTKETIAEKHRDIIKELGRSCRLRFLAWLFDHDHKIRH